MRKYLILFKIGMLSGIPVLLLCLPADHFDEGTQLSFFGRLGVEGYYSEGLTRGIMHLIHFDISGAAKYNRMSFVVLPLLMILWAGWLWKEWKNLRQLKTEKSA